ncbi:MAG: flagellar motor protein MotB [Candidatus Ozemobacteraceae bacterium]
MARKKKDAGHHGGAWKVAYADFVTAMMAFFLVLWILGLSKPTKDAIAAYFNDPLIFLKSQEDKGPQAIQVKMPIAQSDPAIVSPGKKKLRGTRIEEKKLFKKLKDDLEDTLKSLPEFKDISKSVRIEMTREGMRIEFAEDKDSLFFSPGSGEISPALRNLIKQVATPLKKIDNKIIVEGHTDVKPTRNSRVTNWELSTERANSARKILDEVGLTDRIFQVRGFAANKLMVPEDPTAAQNRRISLLVLYSDAEYQMSQTGENQGELSDQSFSPERSQELKPEDLPTVEPASKPELTQ